MKNVSTRVAITIVACLMMTMAIPHNVFADVTPLTTFTSGATISSGAVNTNFNVLKTQMPAAKTVTEAYQGHVLAWTYPTCLGPTSCGWTLIKSITVTTPTSGMVIVLASGFISSSGVKPVGEYSAYTFTVSTSSNAVGPNFSRVAWGENMTHDWYELPFTIHSAFTVPIAGTYTYYLIGKNDGQVSTISVSVYQPQITAIFTPNILP